MQRLLSGLFLLVVLFLGIIVYQQNQILVFQKAEIKQQFHSDLVFLLSLTDNAGFSELLLKDPTEFSAKEKNLVALIIQRLIVAKDLRPAFTKSEWQAMIKEGRDVFELPIFRSRWSEVRGYYDKDTVDFIEINFLSVNTAP